MFKYFTIIPAIATPLILISLDYKFFYIQYKYNKDKLKNDLIYDYDNLKKDINYYDKNKNSAFRIKLNKLLDDDELELKMCLEIINDISNNKNASKYNIFVKYCFIKILKSNNYAKYTYLEKITQDYYDYYACYLDETLLMELMTEKKYDVIVFLIKKMHSDDIYNQIDNNYFLNLVNKNYRKDMYFEQYLFDKKIFHKYINCFSDSIVTSDYFEKIFVELNDGDKYNILNIYIKNNLNNNDDKIKKKILFMLENNAELANYYRYNDFINNKELLNLLVDNDENFKKQMVKSLNIHIEEYKKIMDIWNKK